MRKSGLEEAAVSSPLVRGWKRWWESRRAKVLGGLLWGLARLIGLTLRLRVEGWEKVEAHLRTGQGAVLITWHGRTLIPANFMRGKGAWAMISLSRDGEIQANIFERFGFRIIRGSTGRGGVRAALEAARCVQGGGVLAFTPDGPRGPSQKVQPGTLLIAQKAGCPIFPAGISAYPRKLLPTWDRYLIPMPFARAAFLFGDPIWVPAEVGKEAFPEIAEHLEQVLNALEARAETLVRGGG